LYFNAYSYDKLSIIERFTNSSCVPCANINNAWYNAVTHELVNSGTVAHIVYNGWWPGANDPMYLLNQSDNTSRINYYGVNAVPWIVVNGTTISTTETALENAVSNGNSEYSPFQISVVVVEFSQTLIKYTVTITRDPNDNTTFSNNIKLQFGLTEKTVAFASPQPNGESQFFSICRKMLPNASGTLITIPAPGESTEITLEYVPTSQFLSSVNLDSIRVVSFIQDDVNKYIYQSYMNVNYNSSINSTSADIIGNNSDPADFVTSVKNSGLMEDTYEVHVNMNAPEGWTGEYTTPNGTFTFDQVDQIQVPVNDTSAIALSVNPSGIDGYGEIEVQFVSLNTQDISSTQMRLVTNSGLNGLIIDASDNHYGDMILPAFEQEFQHPNGIVSRDALFSGIDLTNFSLIAWSTGHVFPVFKQYEVDALESFMDNGGRLLIDGQDVGSDIFESSGQSQFAQDFYHNYLHADYVADWGQSYFFQGIAGDPITDQIILSLSGIYDRSPDQVAAFDSYASTLFTFSASTRYSGIRADDGNSKVVYLGFGFEQINDIAVRDTLIAKSVRWLTEDLVSSAANDPNKILTFGLEQNYPNPFNPTTSISYTIPKSAQTTLKVYDVLGNEVATLVNGENTAGVHSVEFNAAKLSSGIYFYKLQSGNLLQTKKMMLLK
jgi:hypothetical protein